MAGRSSSERETPPHTACACKLGTETDHPVSVSLSVHNHRRRQGETPREACACYSSVSMSRTSGLPCCACNARSTASTTPTGAFVTRAADMILGCRPIRHFQAVCVHNEGVFMCVITHTRSVSRQRECFPLHPVSCLPRPSLVSRLSLISSSLISRTHKHAGVVQSLAAVRILVG